MQKQLLAVLILISSGAFGQIWKPLFNGKNLDGWTKTGDSAFFIVEEGAIRLHRKANTQEHTFLRTNKMYRDFILELDCKRDPAFQYGILVRAVPAPDTAHVRLYGYQVKIDHDSKRNWTGGIFDDFGNTWRWLYPLTGNTKAQNALKPPGQWDHYRFELIGETIKVWVNDVPATHLLNGKYREGYIALKIHFLGDNAALESPAAWVKNIRIINQDPARFGQEMAIPLCVVR